MNQAKLGSLLFCGLLFYEKAVDFRKTGKYQPMHSQNRSSQTRKGGCLTTTMRVGWPSGQPDYSYKTWFGVSTLYNFLLSLRNADISIYGTNKFFYTILDAFILGMIMH